MAGMAGTEAAAARGAYTPSGEGGGALAAIWFRIGPIVSVLAVLLALWYALAVWLNAPQVIERTLSSQPGWGARELMRLAWSMDRPVLPAPHQIALDLYGSIVDWPLDSPRNLLFHAAVTSAATLLGFAMGTLLGAVLAVAVVHSRTLDRSLFPWIIASQTVPVLAIAPIVIVILGSLGITGVFPKAIISMQRRKPRRSGSCACRLRCRFSFRRCASASRPGSSARSSASCRPARKPASARGCSPARTTATRCRSGRRW
jgi:hypothetical protein